MIKYMIALMLFCTTVPFSYGGECYSGKCSVRSRAVNVTREIVSVPVTVTRKVVKATRNFGNRTVSRVRNIVR